MNYSYYDFMLLISKVLHNSMAWTVHVSLPLFYLVRTPD